MGDRDDERGGAAEIVRDHSSAVYRFLVHLTGDVSLAEDLTQETFAAAWKARRGFRGEASVATWLHRIALRKALDARRTRCRIEAAETLAARSEADDLDPSRPLAALESARGLASAVGALEPPERLAVILHYYQGLSFRQAAEVLGEPVGTVKWRTSRALARLRATLNAEDHDDGRPAEAVPGPRPARRSPPRSPTTDDPGGT